MNKNIIIFVFIIFFMVLPCSCQSQTFVTIKEKQPLIVMGNYENNTTHYTVSHFLKELEPHPWGGACGMKARFIYLEAQKVNLSIGELTIVDTDKNRVRRTFISGHRVNYYMVNKTIYIIGNTREIYTKKELPKFLRDKCGINVLSIRFINIKRPQTDRR